jgi:hypothetical protein
MSCSHEKCPVCGKDLLHAKYLNQLCVVLSQKTSFVESVCNQMADPPDESVYPTHLFFQITSLYGALLYEKINFPYKSFEVEVNYTKIAKQSVITYFSPPNVLKSVPPTKLEINRLLELDYPKLEKVIRKVKTLAPFL